MRGTGGNQFMDGDTTVAAFVAQVWKQLQHLEEYAHETGRTLDLGAVSVDTKRVGDQLSVTVTADLDGEAA